MFCVYLRHSVDERARSAGRRSAQVVPPHHSPVEKTVVRHGQSVLGPDAKQTQYDPKPRKLHVSHPERGRRAL